MQSVYKIFFLMLVVISAESAVANDVCKNEVTPESLDGHYLLILGDMTIDNSYDPNFPVTDRMMYLSKKAIWLPFTTETMDVRIAHVNEALYLTDGNTDVRFDIVQKFLPDLAGRTLSLFKDLRKNHKQRFEEWKGNDKKAQGEFTLPCYPEAGTLFLSKPTTVNDVLFVYDFQIISHSKQSTLMIGRAAWNGANVLHRPIETAAHSRRSGPRCRAAASNRRMSENLVTPLKWVEYLRFGNGGLRKTVQTQPAASPQGGSEPKAPIAANQTNGR